jgi:hypothetical protein
MKQHTPSSQSDQFAVPATSAASEQAAVREVLLAAPRGFCAGVDRAIDIVEHALAKFGKPIYVRHEIVHNTHVVNDLRSRGAIFIEELDEVPAGATLVFSAHGVSKALRQEAERRGFRVFDATCPLVTKVHVEVAKLAKEGYEFIMIGHKGHPEVEGTMGQLHEGIHLVESEEDVARVQPGQTEKLAVVTQGLEQGGRSGHRGGQPQQQQQQPSGRTGAQIGRSRLYGGRCQPSANRMVRRRTHRGPDRRRQRPRSAGARRGGAHP